MSYIYKLNQNVDLTTSVNVTINFTSFNNSCTRITIDNAGVHYYVPTSPYLYQDGVYNGTTWKAQSYRTVNFETEPTGDLLTWLQANAIQLPSTSIDVKLMDSNNFLYPQTKVSNIIDTTTSDLTVKTLTGGITYTTTAPTEANTDGIKFVVLTSEPATKYDGWFYIITEA